MKTFETSSGMSFCNARETGELSTRVISEAVGKAVAVIGKALAKRPAAEPVAAKSSSPGS